MSSPGCQPCCLGNGTGLTRGEQVVKDNEQCPFTQRAKTCQLGVLEGAELLLTLWLETGSDIVSLASQLVKGVTHLRGYKPKYTRTFNTRLCSRSIIGLITLGRDRLTPLRRSLRRSLHRSREHPVCQQLTSLLLHFLAASQHV